MPAVTLGTKELSIPVAVIDPADPAGVCAAQHLSDAGFRAQERVEVPAGRQGVSILTILRVLIGVPGSVANALDEFGTDTIALD